MTVSAEGHDPAGLAELAPRAYPEGLVELDSANVIGGLGDSCACSSQRPVAATVGATTWDRAAEEQGRSIGEDPKPLTCVPCLCDRVDFRRGQAPVEADLVVGQIDPEFKVTRATSSHQAWTWLRTTDSEGVVSLHSDHCPAVVTGSCIDPNGLDADDYCPCVAEVFRPVVRESLERGATISCGHSHAKAERNDAENATHLTVYTPPEVGTVTWASARECPLKM